MARCVACESGSCAGRVVCGDPPDCDSCEGGSEFPAPLQAQYECERIVADGVFYLSARGAVRVLARGSVSVVSGASVAGWYVGEVVLAFEDLLERAEVLRGGAEAGFYGLGGYVEVRSDVGWGRYRSEGVRVGDELLPLENGGQVVRGE